jgi:hypothetical protein
MSERTMNNATFVMGIVLTMLILFLSLGTHAAQAAEMGDVTLQVLEKNDPTDIVNDIDLPDLKVEDGNDTLARDSHEATHEIEDQVRDAHDEIEDDIDDTKDDIEDSIDQAEVDNEDPPTED